MSTNDMDKYMASLPDNAPNVVMEPHAATTINDAIMINDTAPVGSSLAAAAAKRNPVPNYPTDSQEGDEYQTQEAPFTAVPVTPKRSNKSAMDEIDDTIPMDTSTTDPTLFGRTEPTPAMATPLRAEKHIQHDAPIEPVAETTPAEEYFGVSPTHPIPLCDTTDPIVDKQQPLHGLTTSPKRRRGGRKKQGTHDPSLATDPPNQDVLTFHPPTTVKNTVRIEVRWAPSDFHELRASREKLYNRLAPILSCFNTKYTWMLEWQTDQMVDSGEIDPKTLPKFLSIRISPVVKEGAFYFSFRICATRSQFTQVVKLEVMKTAKKGERMTFDPTTIPPQQGELIFVGVILLKDATNTHRGHYTRYLRKEVLPADTPDFDIKIRHKDPVGNSVKILAVRCGKAMSTKVAEILSKALCGEGSTSEIFISRLAIGANHTSKKEHEQIYNVHMEYLKDLVHIPIANSAIDSPVTEYIESGPTTSQTPRQWAKILVSDDGSSLEIDLENGTENGSAIIISPSASAEKVQLELNKYWSRQNPSLSNAKELYTASLSANPDIPKTVFTKNIDTILAKKFKSKTVPSTDAKSTPASSMTGATSKSSTIAWKTPLQETLKKTIATRPKPLSSNEINPLKRIAILEAQLALPSTPDASIATSSKASKSTRSRQSTKASRSSSLLSDHSPLTAATAHSRLDSLEGAMLDIRRLLKKLVTTQDQQSNNTTHDSPRDDSSDNTRGTDHNELACPNSPPSPSGKSMTGVQLFPDGSSDGTTSLAVVGTPPKHTKKRHKPTESPSKLSNLRPQYKDTPGVREGDKC